MGWKENEQWARDQGYSEEEIRGYERDSRQRLLAKGRKPEEIDAYFGGPDQTPPMTRLKKAVEDAARSSYVTDAVVEFKPQKLEPIPGEELVSTLARTSMAPAVALTGLEAPGEALDALEAGLQLSFSGLKNRGKLPDKIVPESAPLAAKVLRDLGMLAGDMPTMILGGLLGGAAGTAVAGPVGGAIAGVAGATGMTTSARAKLISDFQSGKAKNIQDWLSRVIASTWEGVKAGTVAGVSSAVGLGVAGRATGTSVTTAAVASNLGALPTNAARAKAASEIITMVTAGHAIEGQGVDLSDFVQAGMVLGVGHAAGRGARKLMNEFKERGTAPAAVVIEAASNPEEMGGFLAINEKIVPVEGSGEASFQKPLGVVQEFVPKRKAAARKGAQTRKLRREAEAAASAAEQELARLQAEERARQEANPANWPERTAAGRKKAEARAAAEKQAAEKAIALAEELAKKRREEARKLAHSEPQAAGDDPPPGEVTGPPTPRGRLARIRDRIIRYTKQDKRLTWDEIVTDMDDRFHPIRVVESFGEQADSTNLTARKGAYKLFRVAATAAGQAKLEIETELAPILRRYANKLNTVEEFLVAERAQELDKRGIPSGFDPADTHPVARQWRQKRAYRKMAAKIRGFEDKTFQMMEDQGLVGGKQAQLIKDLNRKHVPFYRVFAEDSDGFLKIDGVASRRLLAEIKGSQREVYSPIESMIRNRYFVHQIIAENRAKRALARFADHEAYPHMKDTIREVSTTEKTTVKGRELEALLDNEGIDYDPAQLDGASIDVFRKPYRALAANEFDYIDQGVRRVFQAPEQVIRAVRALDEKPLYWWLNILAAPARVQRSMATTSPEFGPRNLAKDNLYAMVKTFGDYNPADFVRGLLDQMEYQSRTSTKPWAAEFNAVLKKLGAKEGVYEHWVKSRGAQATIANMDPEVIQAEIFGESKYGKAGALLHDTAAWTNKMAEIVGSQLGGKPSYEVSREIPASALRHPEVNSAAKTAWNVVKAPYDALRYMNDLAEAAPRLGYYRKLTERGVNRYDAAFASRELTIDFNKRGLQTQALTSLVAFWNPKIQGTTQFLESFRKDPQGMGLALWLGVAAPSMLLYLAQKDDKRYQQVSRWQRDMHWVITVDHWEPVSAQEAAMRPDTARQRDDGLWEANNGPILRVPKPPGVGYLFGTIPESILEQVSEDGFSSAMSGFLEENIKDLALSQIPTVGIAPFEYMTNQSLLTGAPVVPHWAEKALPKDRYNDKTPEVLKFGSRMLSDFKRLGINLEHKDFISPDVLESAIRTYTGGLGSLYLRAADAALIKAGLAIDNRPARNSLADWPLAKGFVVRFPEKALDKVVTFPKRMKEARQRLESAKIHMEAYAFEKALQEFESSLGEGEAQTSIAGAGVEGILNFCQQMARKYTDMPVSIMPAERKRIEIDRLYHFAAAAAARGHDILDRLEGKIDEAKYSDPKRLLMMQAR